METLHVLGIDPGLNTTGYAVLQAQGRQARVLEAGLLRPRAKAPLERRLEELFQGVAELLDCWPVTALALEALFSHYKRPQAAILMGHARGVICLAAAQRQVPVAAYAPAEVKKLVVGHGRASKEQVQRAVALQLGLAQVPSPSDVADAMAVALCHLAQLQRQALAG